MYGLNVYTVWVYAREDDTPENTLLFRKKTEADVERSARMQEEM